MSAPSPSDHQLLHATTKSRSRLTRQQNKALSGLQPAGSHGNAPLFDRPRPGDLHTPNAWQPWYAEDVTSLHQASDFMTVTYAFDDCVQAADWSLTSHADVLESWHGSSHALHLPCGGSTYTGAGRQQMLHKLLPLLGLWSRSQQKGSSRRSSKKRASKGKSRVARAARPSLPEVRTSTGAELPFCFLLLHTWLCLVGLLLNCLIVYNAHICGPCAAAHQTHHPPVWCCPSCGM